MSLENLAHTLQRADGFDEANVIYENLLSKRIRIFGSAHPDTQRIRDRLGGLGQDYEADL